MNFTINISLANTFEISELNRNLTAFINRFNFDVSYSVQRSGFNYAYKFTFEQHDEGAEKRCNAIFKRLLNKYEV